MEIEVLKKRSRRKCTQGRKANASGKKHEKCVRATLKAHTKYITSKESDAFRRKSWNCPVVLTSPEFICTSGVRAKADFFWRPYKNLRVRIECKTQNTNGSVDEKLNYVLDNFERNFCELDNENVCVLALEGEYFKTTERGQGTVAFMKTRAKEIEAKTGKRVFITLGQAEFDELMVQLLAEYPDKD